MLDLDQGEQRNSEEQTDCRSIQGVCSNRVLKNVIDAMTKVVWLDSAVQWSVIVMYSEWECSAATVA